MVQDINNIQAAVAENIQTPKEPILSEVDRAEMEEFYQAVSLLLKTFGYDFLEEKSVDIEQVETNDKIEDGFMDGLLFTYSICQIKLELFLNNLCSLYVMQ